jgi:hypothetical protein
MADDKIFTDGMIVKPPRDGAPDFVKASISIKTEEFVRFLEDHTKPDGLGEHRREGRAERQVVWPAQSVDESSAAVRGVPGETDRKHRSCRN